MKISQPYFIKLGSRYWKYFLSIILKISVILSFISDICLKFKENPNPNEFINISSFQQEQTFIAIIKS